MRVLQAPPENFLLWITAQAEIKSTNSALPFLLKIPGRPSGDKEQSNPLNMHGVDASRCNLPPLGIGFYVCEIIVAVFFPGTLAAHRRRLDRAAVVQLRRQIYQVARYAQR